MMVETVETGSRGHSPIVDQPMGNGLQWKEGPGAARIANALIVDQTQGEEGDPQWWEWWKNRVFGYEAVEMRAWIAHGRLMLICCIGL